MSYKKVALSMAVILVTLSFGAFGYSADEDPVTVAGILKAAGCPLTDEQAKRIADFQLPQPGQATQGQRGAGGIGGGINAIFDAKQIEALNAKLGSSPTRGDIPARPRNLLQLVMLEKAGIPLTEKQVAALKAIELPQAGQGGRDMQAFQRMNEAMNAIYTDAQREALSKLIPQMGGGRRPQ